MRIIDADVLKEAIESHVTSMSVCLSMDEHYGKVTMREDCLTDIDNAPTINAVQVVRCKDCKYYNITGCGDGFGWCEDNVVNTGVWDNFYCADGERRDDDA